MAGRKSKIEMNDLLDRIINKIGNDFTIDEVVLFGSYAKGNAHEWSDIDVAVISPDLTKRSIYGNLRHIKEKTKLIEIGLQLFAFPSNLYYNETFIDPEFIREIKNTGKKVYTKEKGADFSCLDDLGLD